MYVPPAFRVDDLPELQAMIRATKLANLVSSGPDGLLATPLPLMFEDEGAYGALIGHVAKVNPHWRIPAAAESLAVFMGPDAYVTPSWYATKRETGKVVPTWNYIAVHAYGVVEFFDDDERKLDVVTRLTDLHEAARAERWKVSDAPAPFMGAQLKGIVGLRLRITRLEGKRKMSQNRTEADRAGVAAGLRAEGADEVAALVGAQRG